MPTWIVTVGLLLVANVFMFFAWYLHLRLQTAGISASWPLWVVVFFSWGIALIEYFLMVPANRIGYEGNGGPFSLMQLKVMQECITLLIFVVLSSILFSEFQVRWNHVLAFLLLIVAVYLVFMK